MLIQPTIKYKNSYANYIKELGSEERYPYPMDFDYSDFQAFVKKLDDFSKGINLPAHLVPNTTYWLIKNNEIVGCSHLRHELNQALHHAGGHIGLGVRPSYRGKGLGKRLLLLTIEKARNMGISDVHIHCYKSNLVSKNLLKTVGALLHSEGEIEGSNERLLRFIYAA